MDATDALAAGALRMRIDGPADAPWLVFSNSLATDLTLWDAQAAALAGRWRILRYDFRGHGGSAPHAGVPLGLDALAADLLAVMDAAGAARVCHVGTSMGALAGLAAAARAPQRFARLVVCGARLSASAGAAADLEARAALALAAGMDALVAPTLAKWFGGGHAMPAAAARVAAMIRATDPGSFAAYARGMRDYDLGATLLALPQRVLLAAGDRDGTTAADFARIATRRAGIDRVCFADCGHLPNLEAAAAFGAALAWLAD
ncbi:MAG: alpha/beta fold hydrolase [Burkholderiales bacterium]|nr:alpha/beta fold hydrolase [Burkholderiales bacterium]